MESPVAIVWMNSAMCVLELLPRGAEVRLRIYRDNHAALAAARHTQVTPFRCLWASDVMLGRSISVGAPAWWRRWRGCAISIALPLDNGALWDMIVINHYGTAQEMLASQDNDDPRPRRPAGGRPADERREAILQAACRVFASASYRSAGTLEIAREAGVGEPTLYRYFRDKRALYLGVLRRCRDHILLEWSRAGEGYSDPLQALDAMGAWYFENARRDPDPLRVRARALADSQEDDTQELLREGHVALLEFVRDLL